MSSWFRAKVGKDSSSASGSASASNLSSASFPAAKPSLASSVSLTLGSSDSMAAPASLRAHSLPSDVESAAATASSQGQHTTATSTSTPTAAASPSVSAAASMVSGSPAAVASAKPSIRPMAFHMPPPIANAPKQAAHSAAALLPPTATASHSTSTASAGSGTTLPPAPLITIPRIITGTGHSVSAPAVVSPPSLKAQNAPPAIPATASIAAANSPAASATSNKPALASIPPLQAHQRNSSFPQTTAQAPATKPRTSFTPPMTPLNVSSQASPAAAAALATALGLSFPSQSPSLSHSPPAPPSSSSLPPSPLSAAPSLSASVSSPISTASAHLIQPNNNQRPLPSPPSARHAPPPLLASMNLNRFPDAPTLFTDHSLNIDDRLLYFIHFHHDVSTKNSTRPALTPAYVDSILQLSREERDSVEKTVLANAKLCVSKGADPTNASASVSVAFRGVTPLTSAAYRGYSSVVKYLLAQGADLNECTDDGESPLHLATYAGHMEIVRELLSRKPAPSLTNLTNRGENLLHLACQSRCFPLVEFMLELRVFDVNSLDNHENSPLLFAAKSGSSDSVAILIGAGADVNVKDRKGLTLFDIAMILPPSNQREETKKLVSPLPAFTLDYVQQHSICTYWFTGESFPILQASFYCFTCNSRGGRVCCSVCVSRCHAGHDTRPIDSTAAPAASKAKNYCECGSGAMRSFACECQPGRSYYTSAGGRYEWPVGLPNSDTVRSLAKGSTHLISRATLLNVGKNSLVFKSQSAAMKDGRLIEYGIEWNWDFPVFCFRCVWRRNGQVGQVPAKQIDPMTAFLHSANEAIAREEPIDPSVTSCAFQLEPANSSVVLTLKLHWLHQQLSSVPFLLALAHTTLPVLFMENSTMIYQIAVEGYSRYFFINQAASATNSTTSANVTPHATATATPASLTASSSRLDQIVDLSPESLAAAGFELIPFNALELEMDPAELRTGGAAVVIRGHTVSDFTPIAFKMMHHQEELVYDELLRREFLDEAQLLSRIRHSRIVQFMGICTEPYGLVTELLDTSLHDVLHVERAELTDFQRAAVALDVARALAYLHARTPSPIIHRDIKSHNILLTKDFKIVKVCDLGIARSKAELKRQIDSGQSDGLGTVAWLAPEGMGVGVPDSSQLEKLDVYSFGMVLYEMLTGRIPWSADSADLEPPSAAGSLAFRPMDAGEIMRAVCNGRRPTLDRDYVHSVSSMSAVWIELIDKTTAAQAAARPSVTELIPLLDQIYQQTKPRNAAAANSQRTNSHQQLPRSPYDSRHNSNSSISHPDAPARSQSHSPQPDPRAPLSAAAQTASALPTSASFADSRIIATRADSALDTALTTDSMFASSLPLDSLPIPHSPSSPLTAPGSSPLGPTQSSHTPIAAIHHHHPATVPLASSRLKNSNPSTYSTSPGSTSHLNQTDTGTPFLLPPSADDRSSPSTPIFHSHPSTPTHMDTPPNSIPRDRGPDSHPDTASTSAVLVSKPGLHPVPTRGSTRLSRHINASRESIYARLIDPDSIASWRVPTEMACRVHEFQAWEGGTIRISLIYDDPKRLGKSGSHVDTYHGRFISLIPNQLLVEVDEFETSNPELQGEMTLTLTLTDSINGGTELLAVHENLPPGLSAADNEMGWQMALAKLATLVEAERNAPSS